MYGKILGTFWAFWRWVFCPDTIWLINEFFFEKLTKCSNEIILSKICTEQREAKKVSLGKRERELCISLFKPPVKFVTLSISACKISMENMD